MKRIWIRRAMILVLAMLTTLGLTVQLANQTLNLDVKPSVAGRLEIFIAGLDKAFQTPPITLGLICGALCWIYNRFLFPSGKRRTSEYLLAMFLAGWLLMSLSTLQTDSVSVLWLNQTQIGKALFAFIGYVPLWLSVIRGVEEGLNWLSKQKSVSMRHPMLTPFCAMLLVWFPQALIRYPGAVVGDTIHQLKEFFGDIPFTAMNPPAHTLLLGVLVSVGEWLGNACFGMFLASLIQMLALAWILSWFLNILQRQKAPALLILGLFVLFLFSPIYSAYATTILKDSACSIAMLLFVIQTMVLVMHPDWFWEHKGRGMILWSISGVFAILMRKNGIGMVAPTVIAVGVWSLFWSKAKNSFRRWLPLVCGILVVITSQGILELITVSCEVGEGSIREVFSIPFQQTARVLRDQDNVPEEEIEIIDRVLDADTIGEKYVSNISDRVKNTFRKTATAKELDDYVRLWSRQMLKYPAEYVDAFFGLAHSVFSPAPVSDDFYEAAPIGGINQNEWQIEDWLNSPLARFRHVLHRWYLISLKIPGLGLLLNMGVNGALVLVLALHTLHTQKKLWLVWLPVLLCLLMLLGSPLTSTRYALPIFYGVPVLLTAACEVRRESEPLETEEQ